VSGARSQGRTLAGVTFMSRVFRFLDQFHVVLLAFENPAPAPAVHLCVRRCIGPHLGAGIFGERSAARFVR
jgi:hypothetical protein